MKKATKFIKKTSAIVLVSAMIISSAAVTSSAVSAEETQKGTISYDKTFYDANKDLCNAIAEGIKNHQDRIIIKNYKVLPQDMGNAFSVAIKTNPEFFYIDNNRYSYSIYSGDDGTKYVYELIPIYRYDEQTTAEMLKNFNAECGKYLADVKNSMTDYEKALVLHDKIALECEYGLSEELYTRSCDAYDAIVNKESTCEGYAAAYSYLLSLSGIDTDIVKSSSMAHAWNKVKLDGSYYNVDVTWDDPVPDNNGLVQHTYFLLSDEEFEKDSTTRDAHYGAVSSFEATNTKYDNALFHDFNSKMCLDDDGSIYAIANSRHSSYKKSLVKYNPEDNTAEVVQSLNYNWLASETSYYLNGFAGLDIKDSVLYYNSPDSVFYYNTKSGETDTLGKIESENQCFGLRVIDGGIYVALTAAPTEKTTLEYFGKCLTTPEEKYEIGDVNNDGVIDISDVTMIQQHLAQLINLGDKTEYADFNGDGLINVSDITAIQNHIAGK